jgi:hypothetical protein
MKGIEKDVKFIKRAIVLIVAKLLFIITSLIRKGGFVFLFSFIVGCSGTENASSSPLISNLVYSPTVLYVGQDGGISTIDGSFDFSDSDGDLYQVKIVNEIEDIYIDITGADGLTSGSINVSVSVDTSVSYSSYFKLKVIDSEGNESNEIIGYVYVLED